MKKILEVIPNLGNGGAEKFVYDLCKNIDRTKFDLTLLLYYNGEDSNYYDDLVKSGIKIICLNKKQGLQLSTFLKVYSIVKEVKPDVIHTHLYVNLYLLPYYVLHSKQKGVHTLHNIAEKEQEKSYRKIMKYLYKHRRVVPVAIGKSVADSVKDEYKIEEFPTIYNGIDTKKFVVSNTKKPHKIKNFIAVGRYAKQKNYPLMINAFKKAFDVDNDMSLTILGKGEFYDDVHNQIVELGLENVVSQKGNVSNVDEYLQNADCFIMSSDYEGMPLSVLEAMSCGLPIISTKAGGVVDIVKDGENGLLVEVGDELGLAKAIMAMDENKIESYGKKSLEESEKYDIRLCVKQYEELF